MILELLFTLPELCGEIFPQTVVKSDKNPKITNWKTNDGVPIKNLWKES
jgi:hypothetical protein